MDPNVDLKTKKLALTWRAMSGFIGEVRIKVNFFIFKVHVEACAEVYLHRG